jgi:phosphoglycerate dehydrogenase-like enzyme
MRVWGINRRGKTGSPVEFIGTTADLEKVLSNSDLAVVTTPLTRETRHLIGADELARMKPDAAIINVGRGAVIEEKALYDRLRTHPHFGAGIDTWWSEPAGNDPFEPAYPFLELPNVVGSPHIADVVPGATAAATRLAIENIRRFLEGESIRGLVDPQDYC